MSIYYPNRLRETRISKGFQTAREFAQFAKVPVSTYFSHENGSRTIKEEHLLLYSSLLNVSAEFLLKNDETDERKLLILKIAAITTAVSITLSQSNLKANPVFNHFLIDNLIDLKFISVNHYVLHCKSLLNQWGKYQEPLSKYLKNNTDYNSHIDCDISPLKLNQCPLQKSTLVKLK